MNILGHVLRVAFIIAQVACIIAAVLLAHAIIHRMGWY